MHVPDVEIAAMFDRVVHVLEVQGENRFRVSASRRGPRVIEGYREVSWTCLRLVANYRNSPGFGKDLAEKELGNRCSGRFTAPDTLKHTKEAKNVNKP